MLRPIRTMNLTGFLIMDGAGDEIEADACGDHLAFSCPECSHPVLATALDGGRGCDEAHPAVCRGCGKSYFLDVRAHAQKLYVHDLTSVL